MTVSRRIVRIGLNVADLDRAVAFYTEALGFTAGTATRRAAAGVAVLRLGAQEIELVRHDRPGEPYPAPRAANDPWFQHFAIVVADMDSAYVRLTALGTGMGYQPISKGGPQRLPPETGSVIAYKFRDPDGHPLELSFIPGSAWLGANAPNGLFLGIDHSGLAVTDIEASIAFYARLVFVETMRLLNRGPAQDRLDGLTGAEVDIVVLEAEGGGPHLELLHYRHPKSHQPPLKVATRSINATRLIVTAVAADCPEDLALVATASLVRLDADASLVPDPDGHLIEVHPGLARDAHAFT